MWTFKSMLMQQLLPFWLSIWKQVVGVDGRYIGFRYTGLCKTGASSSLSQVYTRLHAELYNCRPEFTPESSVWLGLGLKNIVVGFQERSWFFLKFSIKLNHNPSLTLTK